MKFWLREEKSGEASEGEEVSQRVLTPRFQSSPVPKIIAVYTLDFHRECKACKWVTVKRVALPCCAIPLPVLISDYLYRHDPAVAAKLVGCGNAVVELPVGTGREL